VLNLCNGPWVNAINDAAREHKLSLMLGGLLGNMTISYNGVEALPQFLAEGRWLRWLCEYKAAVRTRHLSWKNGLACSFAPYVPSWLWLWLNRRFRQRDLDVRAYSAIGRERLEELDLEVRARQRELDLTYRPRKDAFATRLWALRRVDMGNFNKGTLAGWGFDQRDPTADTRLIEYCLGVPAEQFLSAGVTRALARRAFADRIPAAVLAERRRGQQGADWHERLSSVRAHVAEEVARMGDCAAACRALNLPRLQRLVATWPQSGWETNRVAIPYRMALLRAISTAHFLRKASGSNA
jgi:asparagine synthase (glutamine-hydrolysing)